ncbi:Isotrichodermin C-15 hydroxylase [Cytospora mali]|uniref:Isotrichodermin C-15 hydroxylase n=1 Tax=Cytospora mali TaxID=578113 RepID=A0A194UNV9_CYTMA|nr:Isotrichodermin C-15 hydroxylase [Valsa mali var. pyri (nom. inval.)]
MTTLSYTTSGAIVWALGAILGYTILHCLYNLFFHPLRSFPGPIARRAHILPSILSLFRGQWTKDLLPLVDKYGPVVRVAPNELVFTDPDAWKDIYSHRNGAVVKGEEFGKYLLFYRSRYVAPSILGETRENHALIRRHLSHGFSDKSMRDQEPIITGYIDLLMRQLKQRCVPAHGAGSEKERLLQSKTAFDMRNWFTFTTFDLIGDLAFGEPFGCLEKGERDERVKTIEFGLATQQRFMAVKLLGLESFLSLLARGRAIFQNKIRQQMTDILRRRMALTVERPDFIEGLLKPQKDWNIPFSSLRSNASLLVIAGSETTATLLSGVTYLLLQNPESLKKVTQEVRSTFNSEDEITFSSVQNLSYMLACLKEAMRCYPPVAGPLARVVPKGGAYIAGNFVPEGTVVGVAQYPMYHSDRNFSDPFSFKPERFIEPEKFPDDRMDAVQAFSVGPRDCIGKNLAYAEMRTILARLLFNFDLELVDPQQDWMDQNVYFLWSKPPLNVYLTPVR